MKRKTFLVLIGIVGFIVGSVALLAPAILLQGKGVAPEGAAMVWMRETGVLILSISVILFLLRDEADSRAMRAVLWGNALVHAGLLPIEISAWRSGVITRLDGIAPNSALHLLAAGGFIVFAIRVVPSSAREQAASGEG